MTLNTSFLRPQDLPTIVGKVAMNPIGKGMAYDFFEQNFDLLYLK